VNRLTSADENSCDRLRRCVRRSGKLESGHDRRWTPEQIRRYQAAQTVLASDLGREPGALRTTCQEWSLGYRRQPSVSLRACAKQSSPNGFFNKRERSLGLACFGLGCLGTKLHSRKLVFPRFKTRPGLLQSSGSVPQLVFGVDHEGLVRALSRFSPRFGAPHLFYGAIAKRLGAGLRLPRMLFHFPKSISCLVNQFKSRGAAIDRRMPAEVEDIFAV